MHMQVSPLERAVALALADSPMLLPSGCGVFTSSEALAEIALLQSDHAAEIMAGDSPSNPYSHLKSVLCFSHL
jgi:hypothetical protein